MTEPMPGVVPMLTYEDGHAALAWLVEAFGFVPGTTMEDDGRLSHAELRTEHGLVMLASPTPDYVNPRHHRETCASSTAWSALPWVIDGVLVVVDDVDAHHERASAHGATVLSAPEETPVGRLYRVEDLEGHRWMFLRPAS